MAELEWDPRVLLEVRGAIQGGRKYVTPSQADLGGQSILHHTWCQGLLAAACTSAQMLAVATVLLVSTLHNVGP